MWYVNPPLHALHLCQRSRKLSYTFAFYNNFEKCAKRNQSPRSPPTVQHKKKKTKKLKRNFECPYLASSCCKVNQICCVVYPTWGTAIMQKWRALEKASWSYAHMKSCFFSFLLIYSRCDHRLSWPHDTLPCVLINHGVVAGFLGCMTHYHVS